MSGTILLVFLIDYSAPPSPCTLRGNLPARATLGAVHPARGQLCNASTARGEAWIHLSLPSWITTVTTTGSHVSIELNVVLRAEQSSSFQFHKSEPGPCQSSLQTKSLPFTTQCSRSFWRPLTLCYYFF
ncbi:hypothetical protein IQ07DRAFT_77594 [Pyrenochaeta sp. DS3sAY3a]|nr:hypothetical protein IQ07DRAFT_77594 [Pyrenochaeta sp. DS3sAY3a]